MTRFQAFAERKTREAEGAVIRPLETTAESPLAIQLRSIGNEWTERHYDGSFHLFTAPDNVPAVSLVFVQSRDGNTGADNPDALGGGPADKHVIYEGLSRVAADGVLAGAATAAGDNVLFSLWHPELVALRRELGLPRHPVQIVVSQNGRVDVENALLFNVPEIAVFILAGAGCRDRCALGFASRPWITVVPLESAGLRAALSRLRVEHGIRRISAIGGRRTASGLIDAGLVQDLLLTTSARSAGEPNTPFYTGDRAPRFDLIVKKHGTDPQHPILFEHLALRPVSSPAARAPADDEAV
jgi:riboflavin biosynthesis pyrimidine reductase